jgi:hypothetical protein
MQLQLTRLNRHYRLTPVGTYRQDSPIALRLERQRLNNYSPGFWLHVG